MAPRSRPGSHGKASEEELLPFAAVRRMGGMGGVQLLLAGVLLIAACPAGALEFKLPKDGRGYDTSEVVFVFEREAHEDGYPILEVDGGLTRRMDFMQMEYEVSVMGLQVGQHVATVRLMLLPPGEGEGEHGEQQELHNSSITFYILEPGTPNMRSSLLADPTSAASEVQQAIALIATADALLTPNDAGGVEEARAALREVMRLCEELRSRKIHGALVASMLQFISRGGGLWSLVDSADNFGADVAGGAAQNTEGRGIATTADVLSSEGGAEACPGGWDAHDLNHLLERIHPGNPYEGFDGGGLDYSAGEHQGHDQGLMAALILAVRPRLIIEVGSWKGGSAIQMASVLRRRGWGCRTKLICCDTWLGTSTDLKSGRLTLQNGYPTVYREFMHNVIQAGVSSIVIPIPAPANIGSKFLSHLMDREAMPPADLIFVDGNHDYDDVAADVRNFFPLLSPGGLMFGDDYGWPGVKKAVNEFAVAHNLSVLSPGGRTWVMV